MTARDPIGVDGRVCRTENELREADGRLGAVKVPASQPNREQRMAVSEGVLDETLTPSSVTE